MIFPRPKSEIYNDGSYTMKAYRETSDLVSLYEELKSGTDDLTIKTELTLGKEEYAINIDENGILITVSTDEGLFRAITSLRQLMIQGKGTLPFCEIKDSPDFVYRCYMLDTGAGRIPKVKTILRYIDHCTELKYNEFQLYMESFVFDYKAYPKYTEDFDCLTADDIKFINEYCKKRFIKLVPNINSFGHLQTWLKQDEFKHLRIGTDTINTATINPLLPESLEFLDKMYEDILPLCDCAEYVNVGFDEAGGLGRYQLEEICKKDGNDVVFYRWLNKVADHIREKYNLKCQYWSDMIIHYPESFKLAPKDGIALNWGYDTIPTARMEKRCMILKEQGVPYYVCPSSSTWLCATGRFEVSNFNLRTCAENGREHGAIGYMFTDWGCADGHNTFPVYNLILSALAGQYAWNVGEEQVGWRYKNYFVRDSIKFVNDKYFEGKPVGELIYKLQQYYLLEPERIPGSTLSMRLISRPLTETALAGDFDLLECGDDFYFDNVIEYLKKVNKDVEAIDFDENWKRQILVNSNQAIIGAELCKIRYNKTATTEKIDELIEAIEENIKEYEILWERESFSEGKQDFIGQIGGRIADLKKMKENGNRVLGEKTEISVDDVIMNF